MDNKKIKIVRIINRFNIGGPTFNATFLTRYISDEFETILIGGVPDEGEKDSLHVLREYGVEPIILPELQRNPDLRSDRRAYKKIKTILEEIKPDIVHTHASKAGLLGRRAAFSSNVPIVVHTYHGHVFHSYFGKLKTRAIKTIEKQLAKKSTGIIAISNLQKKELVRDHKICENEKVKVIPLGFDLSKFTRNDSIRKATRKEYNLTEDTVAIAIVGRLAPIKDHTFFLKVIEDLLQKTTKKIQVFIVGDGAERENIEEKVAKINAQYPNTIRLTSWILDISTFNQGMDVLCLTSKNEGTPVSLIEAQAGSIPVISTDVGGVSDIIQNDFSGFVIKKGDFATYSDKLRLLIENDELRTELAKNGAQYIHEKFHYSRLVADMENYYNELIMQKGIKK